MDGAFFTEVHTAEGTMPAEEFFKWVYKRLGIEQKQPEQREKVVKKTQKKVASKEEIKPLRIKDYKVLKNGSLEIRTI